MRRRMVLTKGRSCDGKQRHATKLAARAHLASLLRKGGVRLNIYRCDHCGGYHVGHQPRRKR